MNTPLFSTTFVAYNGEGVPFTFTVNGDTIDEFSANANALLNRYQMLGGFGLMTPQPLEASVRPKTFHIIGWLRGETNNRFDPTQPNPCVWLYSNLPWLDFAVTTVYSQDLDKVPLDWQSAASVGGAPPPADKAKHRWNACDFHVLLLPSFDASGKLETGKTGKTKYRFAEVIDAANANPAPTAPDDNFEAVGTPVEQRQSAPAHAPLPARQSAALPPPASPQRPAPATPAPPLVSHPTTTQAPATDDTDKPLDTMTLMEYARGLNDAETFATLDAATVEMITRMRALDAGSTLSMTVNTTLADGRQRRGQYEFLAGIVDKLGKDMAGYDNMHKEVLSFIFGRPISKMGPPGEDARALFDEIYEGSVAQPSTVVNPATRDAVAEIVYVVKGIEDRLKEDATFGKLPTTQATARQAPVPTAAPIPLPPRSVTPARPAPPKPQTLADDIPF